MGVGAEMRVEMSPDGRDRMIEQAGCIIASVRCINTLSPTLIAEELVYSLLGLKQSDGSYSEDLSPQRS